MALTLYHTPLSPACRKIRLLLLEKELEHSLKQEDVWERRTAFFALNPAGEVPVLIADELTLCGAYAITEFVEEQFPEVCFLGNTVSEKAEVRRLMDWFDGKFDHEVTQNIVFEKVFRRLYGYGEPGSDAIRAGRRNLKFHLEYIAWLLQDRNWLAGDYITLADLSAAAHLSCLDYLGDVLWEGHDLVREWYALIKSRPSFRSILNDRISGFRPPEHYTNPDF